MNDWTIEIEDEIYTVLKTRIRDALYSQYPNLQITRNERMNTETALPALYITFLGGSEVGSDLEGTSVVGINSNIEFRVVASKESGMRDCTIIASEVTNQLKRLRYRISSTAQFREEIDGTAQRIGRASRVIGSSDKVY